MKHFIIIICIMIFIVLVWYFRFLMEIRRHEEWTDKSRVKVSGYISSQPYHNNTKQYFLIGSFLVETMLYPEFYYGDRVEVIGTIDKKVTDYEVVQIRLVDTDIRSLTVKQASFKRWLIKGFSWVMKARGKLMHHYGEFLPEPQVSLLSGILLG